MQFNLKVGIDVRQRWRRDSREFRTMLFN